MKGTVENDTVDLHDYQKIPDTQVIYGTKLLKTLPPQTKLFDNVSVSDSDSSILSGPFSEVVYRVEFESKRKAKELVGKDLYTAFSFSTEFKTAIEEVKKEMIKENPDYLKIESLVAGDVDEIKSGALSARAVKEKEEDERQFQFLQFPDIDYVVEKSDDEEIEDKKKDGVKDKKKKTAKIWLDDDETVFDTMSGYWRLLSGFDEFKISPPWYDAYAEGKEHWLQTEPIPKDVLENSIKKCSNWLSKYFDKK